VSKIIKLYNPRTLVIGGPVGVLAEHLHEPMWIKVRQKERRFWKDANTESIREE
jgi:hypothetical protein